MNQNIAEAQNLFEAFLKEANAQAANNNKAAGMRARKISLEIEKKMKEFRKLSIDAAKA